MKMKCPECNVQQLQGVTKPIKEGYLLKHKKRIFGKDWKENWVVLYEDSTMAWYKNRDKLEMPSGTVIVKEAPEMLAAGQFTYRIPGNPPLPPGSSFYQLMAFGSKIKNEVHWFLAASEDEVNEWMAAISNTLPPAPSKLLEAEKVRVKNGKIMFYNTDGVNVGHLCASMKPVLKKCRNCCTSCEYPPPPPPCYRKDVVEPIHSTAPTGKYAKLRPDAAKSSSCKNVCSCGLANGLLMGHAMSNVSTGWRGWGEGLGWQVAGLGEIGDSAYGNLLSVHHPFGGDVDYENDVMPSALSHEATTIIESTSESAGILSFDFLL